MLSKTLGLFRTDMAIDLGTANTVIYSKGRGVVLNQPSVVAIANRQGKKQVIAVGKEAKDMLGRTPEHLEAIRPMRSGVIADYEVAEDMLKALIEKVYKKSLFSYLCITICVPSDSTQVERRAIQESAMAAGAGKCRLIEEPIAAALGAGLPVSQPTGSMIVDIGGGTTEVAVMSLNGIVYANSIRIGGDNMDDAILNYIRRKYNVLIGETTIERIKIDIGSAAEITEENRDIIVINGRDLMHGVPKELEISNIEIADSLVEPVTAIIEAIKKTLEEIPPELSSDIIKDGITLSGGGALLRDLDRILEAETGLKITLAKDPLTNVALGAGLAIERAADLVATNTLSEHH